MSQDSHVKQSLLPSLTFRWIKNSIASWCVLLCRPNLDGLFNCSNQCQGWNMLVISCQGCVQRRSVEQSWSWWMTDVKLSSPHDSNTRGRHAKKEHALSYPILNRTVLLKWGTPTLWVLVQRTGWRPHTTVAALSHGQSLHLTKAALLTQALLMQAFHRLWEHLYVKMEILVWA